MKLCEGVYAYIWRGVFENNCNMYYFAEPLNMLFDPGLKRHMDIRFEAMQKDGINPEDIKYIVNTHSHPDHFEGSISFMDKDVLIAMHEDEIKFLEQIGPTFSSMMGIELPLIKFDLVMKEDKWNFGETELEIYHTPGHSPGSACIYWPEKKALVCGDLIFDASIGRYDIPGGDVKLLQKSIEKISMLDIEYLLPGHMGFLKGKDAIQKNFDIIRNYFTMI